MPIDFAAVADRYREPFRRETATIDLLFLRIGQRLVLAARRAAAVATTTTHLPDLDFVDGALVVRAMVPPTPGRPVGPDRIVDDLRRGVGQAVAGMEGAITGPANDMAFLDLLGGLARPLRAAAERPDTLVQLLGAATAAFARLSPPDTATSPAGPLADRIVEAAAKVTEAVGTLPALPGAFDAAVAAARATGDSAILGGAQRMEAELLGLRSDARWWILVAVDTAGVATLELLTLQHLVESGLATLATIPGALSTFTEALVPVLTSVREWANWISAVLVVYADAIRAVADLRIVLPGLVTPTLGELFEMGVDGTAKIMRQSLHAGLGVATPALSMAPTQVRGLHDLIDAVLMNPGPVPGGGHRPHDGGVPRSVDRTHRIRANEAARCGRPRRARHRTRHPTQRRCGGGRHSRYRVPRNAADGPTAAPRRHPADRPRQARRGHASRRAAREPARRRVGTQPRRSGIRRDRRRHAVPPRPDARAVARTTPAGGAPDVAALARAAGATARHARARTRRGR